MRDVITLLLVLGKEIKEFLVATNLNDPDLECIPRLCKNLLDVALMESKCLLVNFRAIRTQERAKRNVAMGAAIPLAVDAEGVVAVILNLSLEISTGIRRLRVSMHSWWAWWGRSHESGLNHG